MVRGAGGQKSHEADFKGFKTLYLVMFIQQAL